MDRRFLEVLSVLVVSTLHVKVALCLSTRSLNLLRCQMFPLLSRAQQRDATHFETCLLKYVQSARSKHFRSRPT